MSIRAVICDVYGTLLKVGPPPPDPELRWEALCEEILGRKAPFLLREFNTRCEGIIARSHSAARALGIGFPEIFWPDVVIAAFPDLSELRSDIFQEFLFRDAGIRHTIELMPGAVDALQSLAQQSVLLGIASNAQPYTLRELDEALVGTSLSRSCFLPELAFWSFEHGFSKPDPHVFRLLAARLRLRGIAPHKIMMIGDRWDNDIEPARRQGWQTWHISSEISNEARGDWQQFARSWKAH